LGSMAMIPSLSVRSSMATGVCSACMLLGNPGSHLSQTGLRLVVSRD
jgi:hypothetical protein